MCPYTKCCFKTEEISSMTDHFSIMKNHSVLDADFFLILRSDDFNKKKLSHCDKCGKNFASARGQIRWTIYLFLKCHWLFLSKSVSIVWMKIWVSFYPLTQLKYIQCSPTRNRNDTPLDMVVCIGDYTQPKCLFKSNSFGFL